MSPTAPDPAPRSPSAGARLHGTLSRRRFVALSTLAVPGLLAGYGHCLETQWLDVAHHRIAPRDAGSREALTFIQISDLHLREISHIHGAIARVVREAQPDFLVFTGDSIGVPSGGPSLLLAHSPAYRDAPQLRGREAHFACMLSGHTHGGQVQLFGWAPVRPHGSGPYVEGWYRAAGRLDLFVSRGVGTSLVPVRIGARPEVSIIDWHVG